MSRKLKDKLKDGHASLHSYVYIFFYARATQKQDNGMLEQDSPKVALQTHMVAQIKVKSDRRDSFGTRC